MYMYILLDLQMNIYVTSMLIISKAVALVGSKSAKFCIWLPTFRLLFIGTVVITQSAQEGPPRNVGKQLPIYASYMTEKRSLN
jgi:hypothetical protein